MRTEICDRLGIEFPIFAFTHCRDVAAAVSNAGGIGVLGAVGFTAEQLEVELAWLDEHVTGVYGVDLVIPSKYEGKGVEGLSPEELEAKLAEMVPQGHRDFAEKLLNDHNVPHLPDDEQVNQLLGWTATTVAPQIEVILKHPKAKLVANALGTPPDDVIKQIQDSGRLIGALCGSVKHALKHKEAGLDFVVCQGTEGGGHCGEVSSMVLWPQVIDAIGDLPLLAAGGIGNGRQVAAAMAMGAAGAWTGSIWLTVEEANVPPAQMQSYIEASSHDTVRSRAWTGKPARMLKNDWTEAWEAPENPKPLPMPLQMMVAIDGVKRGHRYPEQAKDVNFNPVGQVVGMMNKVERSADVVARLIQEYVDACERLNKLNDAL
ncbi:nitronate monooxygenase [Nocardia goodfellowii]|uniref:NAD(P)H-dependent flavin oxidoreductase YrpB (Nitropropane dioxygenase family) n=1 Tax=Nocardia goodfellowii TaxID=882446 RepID=A0ABS4Q9K7_9NOCA|nr:nitronate monooxygenase family protein [Nocardia goodfellowii]MBP2188322.1 NAD(P)H-dependent flavin oxidoreductase YrpB (nitropropane dioxygenase family) [Nocardia goodfellowii]